MTWVFVTIFSYFLFSLSSLVDKYLLSKRLPDPVLLSFYVGILGFFALFLIPWFPFPTNYFIFFLAFAAGFFRIFGLFFYYRALWEFETSRVVPAIGAILPISTLFFSLTFFVKNQTIFDIFSFEKIISFLFLLAGGVLISVEKSKKLTLKSITFSAFSAILFSLSFLFSKVVYQKIGFGSGIILILLACAFSALFFLFFKNTRERIIKAKSLQSKEKKKTGVLFLFNQVLGGSASLIQNYAISLTPIAYLAFLNALEGTKYVFLLIFTLFLSLKFPHIIKEEISKKTIFQKILAVLLIVIGLAMLNIK